MADYSKSKNCPILTKEQRLALVEAVDNNLKSTGKHKDNRTVKHTIDEYVEWDKLELSDELQGYSVDELKGEYNQIRTACRQYRIYSEMFDDIKKSAADVTTTSRPINAYARFVSKRMKEMDAQGLKYTKDRFGTIAKEWKNLPQSGKQVFLDEFEVELNEWKKMHNMETKNVPAMVKNSRLPGPKIPLKPIELFCNKFKHEAKDGDEIDLDELRNRFFKLKRSKQLSYIKASMICLQTYRQKVKDYMEENPDYVDRCKYKTARYPLSIREFNMWMENYLDAPSRPQSSAKEQYAHDEDLTMLEATDYWKSLNRKQKDTKNIIFKEKKKKYDAEFAAWYEKQDDFVQEELTACGFVPDESGMDTNDEKDSKEAKNPPAGRKRANGLPTLKSKEIVEESESEQEPEEVEKVESESDDEEPVPSPPKKKKKSKDSKKKKKKQKKKAASSDSD